MNFRPEVRPSVWEKLLRVLLFIGLVGTLATPALAVEVSGSASMYGYMRNDTVKHTQLAPALTMNVHDFGIKDLRLESSLRGYTDIRDGKSEDRRLRLWRGVLVWAPQESRWEVRLGQQWLTEGVGHGNIVGLWAKRRVGQRSSVTAYGGSRLPSSLSLQDRYEAEGFALGLKGQSRVGRFNVGASWFYVGKDDQLLFHGAGVDASGLVACDVMARGRFDINLDRGTVEKAQLLADWSPSRRVDVTGEFRMQTPRVFEDSYFRIFLSEAATTFARLGGLWYFRENLYVRGMGTMLFSENPDPLYKAQVAVGHRVIELGYTRWLSVSKAEWNGLFGNAKVHWSDKGAVFAGFDFARGSNAETNLRPARESQALYFGADVTPMNYLTLSARAEQVKDDRHREWRGLFSVVTRFNSLR